MKFLSIFRKQSKRSKSLKKYYKEHGYTRRVPIKEYGEVVDYIYLKR